MKIRTIVFFAALLLCIFPSSYGQWEKYTIQEIDIAASVGCVDLNGDDKPEIYFCATVDNKNELNVYQNDFPFWIKQKIDNAGIPFMLHSDIDKDGAMDLVASVYFGQELVWYKNAYPEWEKIIIDPNMNNGDQLNITDIDQDNDFDIVIAPPGSNYGFLGDICWYENNHPDWTKHIIESNQSGSLFIVSDINLDGAPEIIHAEDTANNLIIYRTFDKGLNWERDTIDDNLIHAYGMCTGDVDGDDVTDIIATTGGHHFSGSEVVWYKKIASEWVKDTIDTDLDGAYSVVLEDVDGDDTVDIIASGFKANDIVWYENNLPDWTKHIIDENMQAPRLISVVDIDGDNVKDIIAPGMASISWYKNPFTLVASLSTIEDYDVNMSPNGEDSQIFITNLVNPEDHVVGVTAIVRGEQSQYADTIPMYDDGTNGDLNHSDNMWSREFMSDGLPDDVYDVAFFVYDSVSDMQMACPQTARFITLGPVVYDEYSFTGSRVTFNPGKNTSIRLLLENQSATATATDITARLSSLDPYITLPSSFKPFDDIPAGESGESNLVYLVEISEESYIGAEIPIIVEIAFDESIIWTYAFYITVTDFPDEIEDVQQPRCKIYPNPGNEIMTIEAPFNDHYSMDIYSMTGRLISQREMDGRSMQVDLTPFNKGIYFITLKSKEFVWTEKVIKY